MKPCRDTKKFVLRDHEQGFAAQSEIWQKALLVFPYRVEITHISLFVSIIVLSVTLEPENNLLLITRASCLFWRMSGMSSRGPLGTTLQRRRF